MTITRKPLPGYEGILELVTETCEKGHERSRRLSVGLPMPDLGKCVECKREYHRGWRARAAPREEAAKLKAAEMEKEAAAFRAARKARAKELAAAQFDAQAAERAKAREHQRAMESAARKIQRMSTSKLARLLKDLPPTALGVLANAVKGAA